MSRRLKHGGRRKGAGRPPVEGARVSRAISFRVSVDERTRGEALAAAENVAIGELARRAYLARLAEVPPAGPPETTPSEWLRIMDECREMLDAAGLGREGTPNTVWAMVREACHELRRLRDAVTKPAGPPEGGAP